MLKRAGMAPVRFFGWKHRYSVLGILMTANLLCYLDRMVMATAIPFIAKDLQLSALSMGQVLSAFFVGYALMQIPGGLLVDRWGPRVGLTAGILWWSLMTALTGLVPGLMGLIGIRFLFGLGEGPYPPAAAKAVSIWFPAREVGRAQGFHLSTGPLGSAIAPLFVVALITAWGWRSVFYALLIPGALLAVLVWRYVRSSPAQSTRMRPQELAEYDGAVNRAIPTTGSFLSLLRTSPAILWAAISLLLTNTVSWGLLNWLPTYLLQERGFNPGKMGIFTALALLGAVVGSALSGYLSDKYFRHRLRVPIVVGWILNAGLIYLAATAATGELAVLYIGLMFVIQSIATTVVFTMPLILAPRESVGSAFGIVNTAGQIAGVLSPLLVGYVLEVTHGDFSMVLYGMVGLALLATLPASRIRQ